MEILANKKFDTMKLKIISIHISSHLQFLLLHSINIYKRNLNVVQFDESTELLFFERLRIEWLENCKEIGITFLILFYYHDGISCRTKEI